MYPLLVEIALKRIRLKYNINILYCVFTPEIPGNIVILLTDLRFGRSSVLSSGRAKPGVKEYEYESKFHGVIYRPQTKLHEGNVFTGVCLFTGGVGKIKNIIG